MQIDRFWASLTPYVFPAGLLSSWYCVVESDPGIIPQIQFVTKLSVTTSLSSAACDKYCKWICTTDDIIKQKSEIL